MTTREIVSLARRAHVRAGHELDAALRAGDVLQARLARLHWEHTHGDLKRAEAVCR